MNKPGGVLQAKSSVHWKKKYRKRAHNQAVDDKYDGEIVGVILPVEVKKSCLKRKKDVCPKHIYLIEKRKKIF